MAADSTIASDVVPPVWRIMPAARAVFADGVIAYPTEAVFGLGCLPEYRPVSRILRLKQRSARKGLILIAASPAQLAPLVAFPDETTRQQVLATWPGPVTWLLPARRGVPVWLRGEHSTLAVRVSAHPLVQALCRQTGPLISTSANRAGTEPARSTARARALFGQSLDYVLPGQVGDSHRPTEIRDAVTGARVRAGG